MAERSSLEGIDHAPAKSAEGSHAMFKATYSDLRIGSAKSSGSSATAATAPDQQKHSPSDLTHTAHKDIDTILSGFSLYEPQSASTTDSGRHLSNQVKRSKVQHSAENDQFKD